MFSSNGIYPLFFKLESPMRSSSLGREWAAIRSQNDLIQDGASFNGSDLTAFRPDLYFELWFCTDLYGCSDHRLQLR